MHLCVINYRNSLTERKVKRTEKYDGTKCQKEEETQEESEGRELHEQRMLYCNNKKDQQQQRYPNEKIETGTR